MNKTLNQDVWADVVFHSAADLEHFDDIQVTTTDCVLEDIAYSILHTNMFLDTDLPSVELHKRAVRIAKVLTTRESVKVTDDGTVVVAVRALELDDSAIDRAIVLLTSAIEEESELTPGTKVEFGSSVYYNAQLIQRH